MTRYARELSVDQVAKVSEILGLVGDDRVWALAIDPKTGEGAADVLRVDDAVLFTGEQMYLDGYAKYPGTGTIQMTVKKRP